MVFCVFDRVHNGPTLHLKCTHGATVQPPAAKGGGSLNPYRITNRRPLGSVTKKTAKFKGGISGEFCGGGITTRSGFAKCSTFALLATIAGAAPGTHRNATRSP